MGIFGDVVRAHYLSKQNMMNIAKSFQDDYERDQLKALGAKFMRAGDFTPEGIRKFAMDNNVGVDQMRSLVGLVGEFKKLNPRRFEQFVGTGARIPEGAFGQENLETGQVSVLAQAPKPVPTLEQEIEKKKKITEAVEGAKTKALVSRKKQLAKEGFLETPEQKRAAEQEDRVEMAKIKLFHSKHLKDYEMLIDPNKRMSAQEKEDIKTQAARDLKQYSAMLDLKGYKDRRQAELDFLEKKMDLERKYQKDPAFKQKMQTLMDEYGITKKEAAGIILGVGQIIQDPTDKRRFYVDILERTERELTKVGTAQELEDDATMQTSRSIWEATTKGTGIWSAFRAGFSAVSGAVGGPIATETIQDRQTLVAAAADYANAMANSPRFAQGERNWLLKEMNLMPSWIKSPSIARARMIAIEDFLQNKLRKERSLASSKGISPTDKAQANRTIKIIENFIKMMDLPVRLNKSTDEENVALFNSLSVGDEFIDPKGIPRVKGAE